MLLLGGIIKTETPMLANGVREEFSLRAIKPPLAREGNGIETHSNFEKSEVREA